MKSVFSSSSARWPLGIRSWNDVMKESFVHDEAMEMMNDVVQAARARDGALLNRLPSLFAEIMSPFLPAHDPGASQSALSHWKDRRKRPGSAVNRPPRQSPVAREATEETRPQLAFLLYNNNKKKHPTTHTPTYPPTHTHSDRDRMVDSGEWKERGLFHHRTA